MANFFGKHGNENKKTEDDDRQKKVDDRKLELRKEELDIDKNRVHIGDVEISKEIIEEQKTVDVPVTREEVVIERRAIENESSDSPIGDEETIHIPVSEDHIDVDKHTVVTGEVEVFKREMQETKQVKENLKREEARINKDGEAKIIDENMNKHLH